MDSAFKGLLFLLAVSAVAGDSVPPEALVFGGTGRLGAPIVHGLVDRGYVVTVFARPTSDRGRLAGIDVRYVIGDLTVADSVEAALAGGPYSVVIDASARGASRASFYDTAMRNILASLDRSAVRQFILHGSVGAGDNLANFPNRGFERFRDVMQAKGEAEAMLAGSGLTYTIIRNGRLLPDGTPATGRAQLTEDDRVLGAVTRADLAALTLACLDNPDCFGKTYHAFDDTL